MAHETKSSLTEETVTISKKEYVKLMQDQWKLYALESGGVDNWDWYSDSISDYRENNPRPFDED